ALPEALQAWQLLLFDGHDQLAALLVGNALLFAVRIRLQAALGTQPRLERAGRVVDASVDHPRVVTGLVLTGGRLLFEDRDPLAGPAHQQLTSGRQADDAAAHHHDVVPVLGHRLRYLRL